MNPNQFQFGHFFFSFSSSALLVLSLSFSGHAECEMDLNPYRFSIILSVVRMLLLTCRNVNCLLHEIELDFHAAHWFSTIASWLDNINIKWANFSPHGRPTLNTISIRWTHAQNGFSFVVARLDSLRLVSLLAQKKTRTHSSHTHKYHLAGSLYWCILFENNFHVAVNIFVWVTHSAYSLLAKMNYQYIPQ